MNNILYGESPPALSVSHSSKQMLEVHKSDALALFQHHFHLAKHLLSAFSLFFPHCASIYVFLRTHKQLLKE